MTQTNGWPMVSLKNVLRERKLRIGTINADDLPLLGVSNVDGLHRSGKNRISDMSRYLRVERGWFAYNPMRINVGSIGWAKDDSQTGVISPDYVVFSCTDEICPELIYWFLKNRQGLQAINAQTAGSVRERLWFDSLARITFPLPPIHEQRRIVAKIDRLFLKIEEIKRLRRSVFEEATILLRGAFARVTKQALLSKMRDVAPLIRRRVEPGTIDSYPELGIRSFGKGTFHKPAIDSAELGSKKMFRIEPGDLVFNNVFAWEGAIAVAQSEDAGRFGSHRFITCVPKTGTVTADFLCFYFLTPEGLETIGKASPGGAGRNRTLGLEKLAEIDVPVPAIENQRRFDRLQGTVKAMLAAHHDELAELDAMLPSLLDRAFKGAF